MRRFVRTSVPQKGYEQVKKVGEKWLVHLEGTPAGEQQDTLECYECMTDSEPDIAELTAELQTWKAYVAKRELAVAKMSKIAELEAYDDSNAVNGFIIRTAGGDITEWLDPYKRNNAFRAIESAKKLGDSTISFAIGDVPVTLNVETAEVYLARVERYAVSCANVTAGHKAAINALESVDAVEGYDYTTGYPTKLVFEV